MRATVLTPEVAGGPGDRAEIEIEVSNTLDVVDNIALVVRGVDPTALSADRPSVSLFPGEEAVITLTLDVPEALPAGINELTIDVVSVTRPDLDQQCTVIVDVEPVNRAELKLTPEIVRAKSKGTVQARYTNTGNTVLEMTMLARDDERHLRFDITPSSMLVAPGTTAVVDVVAKGRRPFLSAPAYRTVYVNAESEAGLLDDTVSFVQQPRIPRGVLTAALLSTIVGIWALVFIKGLELVLKEEGIPKGAPETFVMPVSFAALLNPDFVADPTGDGSGNSPGTGADGETGTGTAGGGGTNAADNGGAGSTAATGTDAARQADLNKALAALSPSQRAALTAVFASTSGTVVGDESGEAIPRVAVEAHRERPGRQLGSRSTLVQVATTDLQGNFSLTGMLPGEYYFLFAGPGIKDQWYDGESGITENVGSAEPVRFRSGSEGDLDTIPIMGELGQITGIIDTGDLVAEVEVVVRKYIGDVPQERDSRTLTFTSTDADGDDIPDGPISYLFDNLETPLEYHLTFRTERFDEQVIIEDVGPGEALEARPVRLAPGDASVEGTIVFIDGTPDEPVTVTATDGRDTFITRTPPPTENALDLLTTSFDFDGLRSPATYQFTFEVEGFEDVTATADLKAGESRVLPAVEMQGETRRIDGQVIEAGTEQALGDVRIEVLRPTGTSVTFSFPGPPTGSSQNGDDNDCLTPVNTVSYLKDEIPKGEFVLENLEVGTHAVTFSKDGWSPVTHRLVVTKDGKPEFLDPVKDGLVTLVPARGEVCGTVFLDDGPDGRLTDGVVRLELANGPDDESADPQDVIELNLANDPPGFFKITALAAGDYTLTIVPGSNFRQSYRTCTVRFQIAASTDEAERRRKIDLSLSPDSSGCAKRDGG